MMAQDNDNSKIKWYTFEEAIDLLEKEPKKVFIDVYTDWCGWCKKMDAGTFSHPDIVKYMNENYYAVKFNAEGTKPVKFKGIEFINENKGRRPTHQLAQALLNGKMSYPSYVFMNEKSELITIVPGYMEAKAFDPILHFFAEDKFLTEKWEAYNAKFESVIK
jgi:thioredoxin-related protein